MGLEKTAGSSFELTNASSEFKGEAQEDRTCDHNPATTWVTIGRP